MVCPRCIMAVKNTLDELDITNIEVRLGEVILSSPLNDTEKNKLKLKLADLGFELLDDTQQQTIELIKTIIIQQIHYQDREKNNMTISEILSSSLQRDYATLSKLFSTVEGITIEQYVILQKTEKVKELLTYGQKTLSEIAFEMNYSSVAHLSAQFKKITGLTPTQFKSQGIQLRQSLDKV